RKYPWTMGWQPNYRTEAGIYATYALDHVKDPKFAVLYQNDDFGKDYPAGVRDVLARHKGKIPIHAASYETTDPTIDSQIEQLQATGANVLVVGGIPKFAAQAIRKVHSLNWKPLFFMTNVSISVGEVMRPAGPEAGVGILSTGYLKDPTDPSWDNDPAMKAWRGFMAKYQPGGDVTDASYVFGYGITQTMVQVLRQCKGNFSRENVMRQAENLHDLEVAVLLPGIKLNTSRTDHRPIKQMQMQRWDGTTWKRFGELMGNTV
ncbi:MAG: ABC transporter substrate-binding protein, partial [Rhodospirillales bacterium]|nr:ABC transporter substrate-binding protein [Rhodospirillales bacterium]